MKRKAFILTEILTGMMLQSMFVLTLFGAFYMILSFGTSTQQVLAAHDEGQMVISYIDNRIRNAGLGLQNCGNVAGVATAFKIPTNMTLLKTTDGNALHLPVAITSKIGSGNEEVSYSDDDNKIYEGNILTLLYAKRDNKDIGAVYNAGEKGERLVVYYKDTPSSVTSIDVNGEKENFQFVYETMRSKTNFIFTNDYDYHNIKSWAVMAASGVPVRVFYNTNDTPKTNEYFSQFKMVAKKEVYIYPMSELLNLECQRMFVDKDPLSEGRGFIFGNITANGDGWDTHYHTKGILELYMTLDTNANPPIFDLKVLVSEGFSDTPTPRPTNWPQKYWYEYDDGIDFRKYNVHVAQASWKLYNLAPLFP